MALDLINTWNELSEGEGRIEVDNGIIRIYLDNYQGGLRDYRYPLIKEYVNRILDNYPSLSFLEREGHIEINLFTKEQRSLPVRETEKKEIKQLAEGTTIYPTSTLLLNYVKDFLYSHKMNISDTFIGLKFYEKDSTSNSVLISGDINFLDNDYECMLKLSFDNIDPLDNRNKVESDVYNVLGRTLSLHTPHILDFYGYYKCGDIKFSTEKEQRKFEDAISAIESEENIHTNRMEALFLEKVNGGSLENNYDQLSSRDLYKILFQIMYTLKCFDLYNMVHIDLHDGNVLIEKHKEEVSTYYQIEDSIFRISSKYVPKIYDFDRSRVYNPKIARNFALDKFFCKDFGTCNENDIVSDVKTLLRHMESRRRDMKFPDFDTIDEYISYYVDILKKKGEISVTKSEPFYVYKFPSQQLIKRGNPTLSINGSPLDVSLLQKSKGDRLKDLVAIWSRECKNALNYDATVNRKILKSLYLPRYNSFVIPEEFAGYFDLLLLYLSFPMFYKLSNSDLRKTLNKNEYLILKDMIDFFGNTLPIELPLI